MMFLLVRSNLAYNRRRRQINVDKVAQLSCEVVVVDTLC